MSDACNAGAPRSRKPPNILLILADQLTLGALGAYGNPWVRTPNIDSLARFGVRFEQSICTAPVCTPSRGSLITGCMPHTHRAVYLNQVPAWEGLPNVGRSLREAGYRTVWGGKWHLPASYPLAGDPKLRGEIPHFEVLPFYPDAVDEPGLHWALGACADPPLATAAEAFFAEAALDERPWMLALSFHQPHDICYFPSHPEWYPDPLHPEAAPPLPTNHAVDPAEPDLVRWARTRERYGNEVALAQRFTETDWRRYVFQYYRMVEELDTQVGRVVRALEQAGLEEDTVIVFTSDHGDGVAAHKWASKLSLYAESVGVPLIVTQFGATREGVLDREHQVSGLDLVPTLLDYAGAEVPTACQGRSLRPLVEGREVQAWPESSVSELALDPHDPCKQGRLLQTLTHTYMAYGWGEQREQLYDRRSDPGQQINRAHDPAAAPAMRRHRAMLAAWCAETGDAFEVPS